MKFILPRSPRNPFPRPVPIEFINPIADTSLTFERVADFLLPCQFTGPYTDSWWLLGRGSGQKYLSVLEIYHGDYMAPRRLQFGHYSREQNVSETLAGLGVGRGLRGKRSTRKSKVECVGIFHLFWSRVSWIMIIV